jgi:hypothetical protein
MMIVGWSVLGSFYLISTFVGTSAIDEARCDGEGGFEEEDLECTPDESLRRYGRRMLIPVVGPFMAAATEHGNAGAIFLGVNQVAGLVLGIIGTVRYATTGRSKVASLPVGGGRTLSLDVQPTTGGGAARATLRF